MAPEQIRGEDVTAATDVYALGCVMFECLSGTPPFADRSGMRILWAHLQEDPPDPLGRAPGRPGRRGLGDHARAREGAREETTDRHRLCARWSGLRRA